MKRVTIWAQLACHASHILTRRLVSSMSSRRSWLVAKKYLAEKERDNKAAIKQAIESFLSAMTPDRANVL
jgi:hypothetical protein